MVEKLKLNAVITLFLAFIMILSAITVEGENNTPDTVFDSGETDEDSTNNIFDVLTNDSPVANDDEVTVYFNSSNNVINVLANDIDPDGDDINLDPILVVEPNNGTAIISNNVILYTPDEGFIGTDSFEYNITDGKGGSDTAKVTVNVVKNISGVIVKPRKDYLCFRNQELFKITQLLQFIDADALIIGPITVNFKINDSDFITEKVEFYIDGELKNTTSEMPYNWTFNERFFNICTIKIVAYGTIFGEESTINDEIDVLILNLG